MKKRLCRLLALLILFNFATALAAPVSLTFFGDMLDTGLYVPVLYGQGEDLYAIASGGNTAKLIHWRVGMDAPETWDEDVLGNSYYGSLEEANEQTGKNYPCFIDALFIRDGLLYALGRADGKVFSIAYENGKAAYEEKLALNWSAFEKHLEEGFYFMDVEAMGDKLYVSAYCYNQQNPYLLMEYDLNTGDGRAVNAKHVNGLTPYKDGKLIVTVFDQNNAYDHVKDTALYPSLHILNPKDGSLEKITDCDDAFAGGIAYDPQTDALYFKSTRGIEKMPGLNAPVLCAYGNIDYYGTDPATLLDGGLYAYVNRLLYVKSTDPNALSKVVLNAMNVGDKATLAFNKARPDVALKSGGQETTVDDIIKAGVAKDASVDVFSLYSQMNTDALIDKGYLLDLSSSGPIRELMGQMHPAVQNMCMRGEQIFMVPSSAYAPAMCYENYTFKNMELPITKEAIPTNYLDFLGLMKTWFEEYAQDYKDVAPFNGGKSYLFYTIQNEYINYYTYTGQPLSFDTELFRSLLAALDAVPFPDPAKMTEEDMYKSDMIMDYGNPLEGNGDRIGMSLTKDTPYIATLDMTFLAVNANTKNPDAAITLLEFAPLDYEAEAQLALYPARMEPVESPRFEQEMKALEDRLVILKKRLETCQPSDKAGIEDEIRYAEDTINNPDQIKYLVQPATLAQFRSLVKENMLVNTESILYSSGKSTDELHSLQERYLNSQITAEEYIKNLERIVTMIQKEKQ